MPPKNFYDLPDEEADAFFERFATRIPRRLDEFRREVEATGGPGAQELDGSPDSLVPIWEWFVARNEGGRARGQDAELPPWYEPDPPEVAAERVPPATLRDADGVALYLAEVFKRGLPGLEWGVARMPRRMLYESQNRPVLTGEPGDVDVISVAYVMSLKVVLDGKDTDPEALLRTYRAWVE